MVDCPTVWHTVHFQIARLLHFVVEIAVVPEVFVDCFATDVVSVTALCCAYVYVRDCETDYPKNRQIHSPQVSR